MIAEVYPNIYVNKIPLPEFTIKSVNSYIILSEERNLIIDTGFNREECRLAMMQGVKALNINLRNTDIIVTHMHPDHIGLASYLQDKGAAVYIGKSEGELIPLTYSKTVKTPFEKLCADLFSEENIALIKSNKAYGEMTFDNIIFNYLIEGNVIKVGDYSFQVIDIPGHSPGHIGLYEDKHQLLFCGDLILEEINPSVMFWEFEQDILSCYLNSLKKVNAYKVKYLFTGHYKILRDHRKRIDELISHYQEKLGDIENIIIHSRKTPQEVATLVQWYENANWDYFSKTHQYVAIGETLSML